MFSKFSTNEEHIELFDSYGEYYEEYLDARAELRAEGELDLPTAEELASAHNEARETYVERLKTAGIPGYRAASLPQRLEKEIERRRAKRKEREEKLARAKRVASAQFVQNGGTKEEFEELWPELEKQQRLRELTEAQTNAGADIEFPSL